MPAITLTLRAWIRTLVAALAVLSALQIFVLNPLAAAPDGRGLGRVYADLGAAGEGDAHRASMGWPGAGVNAPRCRRDKNRANRGAALDKQPQFPQSWRLQPPYRRRGPANHR